MEELTNKLLELKIESDGAVEIANKWITYKYFEMFSIPFQIALIFVCIAILVIVVMKTVKKLDL
jgi:hypothetical protein